MRRPLQLHSNFAGALGLSYVASATGQMPMYDLPRRSRPSPIRACCISSCVKRPHYPVGFFKLGSLENVPKTRIPALFCGLAL